MDTEDKPRYDGGGVCLRTNPCIGVRNHLKCRGCQAGQAPASPQNVDRGEDGALPIRWFEKIASEPRRAVLVLLALCVLTYLPGVLRLPAVDRTEVIWAESTREMMARGNWLDPRYDGTVHAFRPIGTYWAQAVTASISGPEHARDIRVYRVPGLIAVTLAVLALYWFSIPLIGGAAAAVGAGLFATAPLTVLLSQLAIADGLALLPAVVAMLTLLRLYVAEEGGDTRTLGLVFWGALGFGMLVNALHAPILVAATLIALCIFDREISWLRRLHPVTGIPLALLIATPWLIVRAQQDGVPFAGLEFKKLLAALGGAQDMKLRAFPGTFVLAAGLGFLPGTALLYPALKQLWGRRGERLPRFLLAWIIGYIAYLELISSKPGTYTVQVLFPALALAVATFIWQNTKYSATQAPPRGEGNLGRAYERLPRGALMPWPPLAMLLPLALFAAPYVFLAERTSLILLVPMAATALLFFSSARAGRAGDLETWTALGIAAFSLFAVTLLAGVLPGIEKMWPARQIARAIEGCPRGPITVLGFHEPSTKFSLNSDPAIAEPEALRAALVEGRAAYIAGEARDEKLQVMQRFQYRRPRTVGCTEAYSPMTACRLYFTIQSTGDVTGCTNRERFACTDDFRARAEKARADARCN